MSTIRYNVLFILAITLTFVIVTQCYFNTQAKKSNLIHSSYIWFFWLSLHYIKTFSELPYFSRIISVQCLSFTMLCTPGLCKIFIYLSFLVPCVRDCKALKMVNPAPKSPCWNKIIDWMFLHSEVIINIFWCKIKWFLYLPICCFIIPKTFQLHSIIFREFKNHSSLQCSPVYWTWLNVKQRPQEQQNNKWEDRETKQDKTLLYKHPIIAIMIFKIKWDKILP